MQKMRVIQSQRTSTVYHGNMVMSHLVSADHLDSIVLLMKKKCNIFKKQNQFWKHNKKNS